MMEQTVQFQAGKQTYEFRPIEESPCRRACPAGIDVKKYIGQIANRNFEGALETIRTHMPFPSVCGRICLHPCETECSRGKIDSPIAIMALKRFAIDYEIQKGILAKLPERKSSTGKRVAIVGSGPAGLSSAYFLALMGHKVTVFEKEAKPGGMLTQAIPQFAVPEKNILSDIERILSLGVEVRLNTVIDVQSGLGELFRQGNDAILIATGAYGRWRGFDGAGWIPGGMLEGIQGAVEFMKEHRNCTPLDIHEAAGKVVVLGFGVQALACARMAVRINGDVTWAIPFEKRELQPDPRLVKMAEEEGVKIIERLRPVAIEGRGGKVSGVKFVEVVPSEPDHTGRRYWKSVEGSSRYIECGSVIDAMYFASDAEWDGLSTGPWGTIRVDFETMSTSRPAVFAAGDSVTGMKSVVEAVALGHRAAVGINSYLQGVEGKTGSISRPICTFGWQIEDPQTMPSRAYRLQTRDSSERIKDCLEVEVGFTAWQAEHEAGRCLLCGPCDECGVCIPSCTRKRAEFRDEKGNVFIVRLPYETAAHLFRELSEIEKAGLEFFAARVELDRCRGCGVCEEICLYHAPRLGMDRNGRFVSSIDMKACKGCGTCVAACPSAAIDQGCASKSAVRTKIAGGVE